MEAPKIEGLKRRINYDRGVMFRMDETTGMNIYMYLDTPGVYLNAFEHEVPASAAQRAGFDTETYGRERVKRERMRKAMETIEAELAIQPREPIMILSAGEFKVMDIGLDRYNVADDTGNVLNTTPLPLQVATMLLRELAPGKEVTDHRAKENPDEVS